jgi:hypothetical protein
VARTRITKRQRGRADEAADEVVKTAATKAPAWLAYYPGLYYRDLVPVDSHHTDALRERDLQLFVEHGPFCRRPIPHEFGTETMALLNPDSYVAVSFYGDKWRRQLAAQRVTVHKSRRQVKS